MVDGGAKVNPAEGTLLMVLLEPNENPENTHSFSSLGSSGFFFSMTSEGEVVKVKPLRENLLLLESLFSGVVSAAGAAGVVVVVEDGVAKLTVGLAVAVSLRVNLKPTVPKMVHY